MEMANNPASADVAGRARAFFAKLLTWGRPPHADVETVEIEVKLISGEALNVITNAANISVRSLKQEIVRLNGTPVADQMIYASNSEEALFDDEVVGPEASPLTLIVGTAPETANEALYNGTLLNDPDRVRAALDAGADPNWKHLDYNKRSPLLNVTFLTGNSDGVMAASHVDIISQLLKAGADPDQPDHFGNTPREARLNNSKLQRMFEAHSRAPRPPCD